MCEPLLFNIYLESMIERYRFYYNVQSPKYELQLNLPLRSPLYKGHLPITARVLLSLRFYTPVFRRDVLWYGDVRPGLHPGLRPSSLRPPVFRTFLLYALTSWAEILHMTLFWCTTDQVIVSSLCVNFLKQLYLFVNLEYGKCTVFRTFLLHALTYWAEILHMTLFWCTTEQVRVPSLCVNFWRSYASFGT